MAVTLSEVELVLRVASAALGASEVPANTNAGPFVERVLLGTHTPKGNPWCAAWVSDVGRIALGAAWPVPVTASVAEIAEWAKLKGHRYGPSIAEKGDLFALWVPSLKRYAHVGFVLSVEPDGRIQTLEGNTSGAGERDGWMVASKTRTLGKLDRVIRWVDAL